MNTELTVRTMGRLVTPQDFNDLIVKEDDDIVVRFRDIGHAELAPENQRQRLVAELQADSSYSTEEARAKEFSARGRGCRATYFNHSRRLKAVGLTGHSRASRRIAVPATSS